MIYNSYDEWINRMNKKYTEQPHLSTKVMKNYLKIDGKKIELSDKTARNLKEQFVSKDVLVPDCIKIGKEGDGDNLGILFNGNKQVLNWAEQHEGIYNVYYAGIGKDKLYDIIQCKLIPCKREDLKPGDTAYRTDGLNPEFSELTKYCKILSLDKIVSVSLESVIISLLHWNYWYKVVPL